MSTPGWYPDPAGLPNRLRYWDGRAWTTKVNDNASGDSVPGGGGGTDGPGSKRWIWAAVAGVVVLALVVVLVIWNPFQPGNIAGPEPTNSPTGSVWNESETPTPTPTPTPSEPSPSITELRCDQEGSVRSVNVNMSGTRLAVGPLSMPAPTGTDWEGPKSLPLVRYGQGAYGYTKVIEKHSSASWSNTMILGPTNFAAAVDLETQARTIIACLAGTDPLTHYKAPAKLDLKKATVSGHSAIQADAVYSWDHSELDTKGSLVRVVVVDTADGPYFFLGEATKERADMIAVMNQLSAGLALS